jgi:oxygen-dependent protoporphyrinogen oxidase
MSPTHVISCIPLPKLDTLLNTTQSVPHLKFNPSSTVTVVNLVFPCAPSDLHPTGFGYLLPRPLNGYEDPDTDIIGVVFDSCSLSEQDTRGSAPITKLTVMCGGPYENGSSYFPVETLLARLFQQLGRARMEPIHVRVQRQVDCIPLPLIGHLDRMAELKRILSEEPWHGRLHVSGAGVSGAGIADCVQAARTVALNL